MRTHVNNGGHKSDAGRWRGAIAHPLEEVQSLVGGVLTTAIVIPLVAWAAGWTGHWFTSKVSPEEYLSAVVDIPSPAGRCNGWVFDKYLNTCPGCCPTMTWTTWTLGQLPTGGSRRVETTWWSHAGPEWTHGCSQQHHGRRRLADRAAAWHVPENLPALRRAAGSVQIQADLDATPVSVTAVADDPAVAEGQARRPSTCPMRSVAQSRRSGISPPSPTRAPANGRQR